MSADILGTSWDRCRSTVQYSFTSTETRRLVRTDSPGWPPRLSNTGPELWYGNTNFPLGMKCWTNEKAEVLVKLKPTTWSLQPHPHPPPHHFWAMFQRWPWRGKLISFSWDSTVFELCSRNDPERGKLNSFRTVLSYVLEMTLKEGNFSLRTVLSHVPEVTLKEGN